jgi:hypothetical protein
VQQFRQVLVIKTVVELFVDISQVSQIEFSFSMSVQQDEVCFSAFFGERISNLVCEFSDEALEIKGISVVSLVDFLYGSVDEFVFLFESESLGSH